VSNCRLFAFIIDMGSRTFDFCANIVIFFIIGIVLVICDAAHYMKKDHSLIKPYAGMATSFGDSVRHG